MRIPPAGLIETIIGCEREENDGLVRMLYKVKNPGWLTFPAENHQGSVTFRPEKDGTVVGWTVKWTPFQFCGLFTQFFVELIVNQCIRYTTEDE